MFLNSGNYYGKVCRFDTTVRLAKAFRKVFRLKEEHVIVNELFAGGYITRTYGNIPISWIQIEMNRCLCLDDRWFNPSEMKINENWLKVQNRRFQKVAELFFEG